MTFDFSAFSPAVRRLREYYLRWLFLLSVDLALIAAFTRHRRTHASHEAGGKKFMYSGCRPDTETSSCQPQSKDKRLRSICRKLLQIANIGGAAKGLPTLRGLYSLKALEKLSVASKPDRLDRHNGPNSCPAGLCETWRSMSVAK